jgi:hypothetical protein
MGISYLMKDRMIIYYVSNHQKSLRNDLSGGFSGNQRIFL